jgi:hypothetical protein
MPGLLIVYASPGTPGAADPPGPMIIGYPYMFTPAMLLASAGSAAASVHRRIHASKNVCLSIPHPFNITIR